MDSTVVAQQLRDVLASKALPFLASEFNVRLFTRGTYQLLFRVHGQQDDVLVRVEIDRDEFSGRGLAWEHQILQRIPAGIAPQPLYIDTTMSEVPFGYRIETLCPGTRLETFSDRAIGALAHTFGRLHGQLEERSKLDTTAFPSGPIPELAAFLGYATSINPEVLRLVERAQGVLDRYPFMFQTTDLSCIVHGDIHSSNILVDDDQSWLIDWEHAMLADPALDVASLFWVSALTGSVPAPLGERQRSIFFEPYISHTGDDELPTRVLDYEIVVVALQLTSWNTKLERIRTQSQPSKDNKLAEDLDATVNRSLHLAATHGLVG